MVTLLSRIRRCLAGRQSNYFLHGTRPDSDTASLDRTLPETVVGTHSSARVPGTGRRSNRDRKSSVSYGNPADWSNTSDDANALADEKAALEKTIRHTIEKLPTTIKQSYMMLLNALLTQPESTIQIERIKALHVAVLEASNNNKYDAPS